MPDVPVCDRCGRPYVEGDAIYTIASAYDESDQWIMFRHYECKEADDAATRRAFADFDAAAKRTTLLLEQLRLQLARPRPKRRTP